MITEVEAKKKWCPLTNVRPVDGNWVEDVYCCLGSKCAWWKEKSPGVGECGVSGDKVNLISPN